MARTSNNIFPYSYAVPCTIITSIESSFFFTVSGDKPKIKIAYTCLNATFVALNLNLIFGFSSM